LVTTPLTCKREGATTAQQPTRQVMQQTVPTSPQSPCTRVANPTPSSAKQTKRRLCENVRRGSSPPPNEKLSWAGQPTPPLGRLQYQPSMVCRPLLRLTSKGHPPLHHRLRSDAATHDCSGFQMHARATAGGTHAASAPAVSCSFTTTSQAAPSSHLSRNILLS
jgi:hypothetical protein